MDLITQTQNHLPYRCNMCQFGNSFPLESVKYVVQIIRSGDIDEKKWKLIKEICCAIGTAANMMDDNIPDDLMGASASTIDEETLAKLDDFVASQENKELMQAIPWLAIIKILLPILIQVFGEEEVPRD